MPSVPQRSLSSPQTPVPREGNGMELGRGGYVLGPRDIHMLTLCQEASKLLASQTLSNLLHPASSLGSRL